jgi:hypothetical protein
MLYLEKSLADFTVVRLVCAVYTEHMLLQVRQLGKSLVA